jgi:transcriptional regulator with XRE-family HTH domain
MTQEQFADRLGVSYQSVSRWENGVTYPDIEFLPAIAKQFSVSLDYLLGQDDTEKVDPYNGYILSPLYDKLFDRGFITFTENRHVILSEFISPYTWKQIGLKNNTFVKTLIMDDKRTEYLKFHHTSVFKGSLDL